MNNSNISDLLALSLKDLHLLLVQYKRELFVLRFQRVLGELTDTSKFKSVKRSIARVKTEISKRKEVF